MQVPRDCTLLPLSQGALLVSQLHAVFCRVPPKDADSVKAVIAQQRPLAELGPTLLDDLDRHGFFGRPREAEPESPSVQLQLTNACNLACRYCCTNSGRPRGREVTFEQIRQVVRQIPDVLGPKTTVSLLGGEPLLVPWALALASEIVALGLHLNIFTNGTPLVDPYRARETARLVDRGAQVRISLAGPQANLCDALSGTSRFEAALAGLQQLARFGGRATVDMMLVPQYVEALATELPVLRKRFPPETPITLGLLYRSGRETGEHLFGSRAALESALDRIAFEAGETIAAPRTSPVAPRREGCGCALGQNVHVRSDGALFHCFKMEEQVGDLAAEGFAATARFIRAHPRPATALPRCRDCPLATLCGGGCRSENLLYSGNPEEPPCGPWRVRVLSELLSEDRVTAVTWPIPFLLHEARVRGIETPAELVACRTSRHLIDIE